MAEMRFVQLDEKNEERMNAIRKFTLMDDTFMTQVFSGDKESTQELLRIILKRKDLTVARSATQLTIGNLFGRSVRLDIYATDDAGKQYDIEVQQEGFHAVHVGERNSQVTAILFSPHFEGVFLRIPKSRT